MIFQPALRQALRFLRGCAWSVGTLILFLAAVAGAHDTNRAGRASRGFSYQHEQDAEHPWSIHILKIDRANTNLVLHSTLPKAGAGLITLSEHIKSLPAGLGTPVAAINGDYYTTHDPYIGDPKGLQILQGELVSAPSDWTCFWIDAAGTPHMTNVASQFRVTWPDGGTTAFGLNEERTNGGAVLYTPRIGESTRTSGGVELVLEKSGGESWLPLQAGTTLKARVRTMRESGNTPLAPDVMVLSLSPQLIARLPKLASGLCLEISTATSPNLTGVRTAVGGGPALVRGGKAVSNTGAPVRHPRSAIGWNATHLFLVEVDGRQPNLSVGMTIAELSEQMIKLGCVEAMNLDGGGSATFWVFGQVMNSPSEGRERGMANALVLIQKDRKPGTTPPN